MSTWWNLLSYDTYNYTQSQNFYFTWKLRVLNLKKSNDFSLFKTFKVLIVTGFCLRVGFRRMRFFIWKFLLDSFISKFPLIQLIHTVADFNGVRVVGDTFKWYFLLITFDNLYIPDVKGRENYFAGLLRCSSTT